MKTNASQDRYLDSRRRVLACIRETLSRAGTIPRAPEQIDPDAALFGSGLALDSIDAIELGLSVERDFGVRIPEGHSGLAVLRSANAIVDYVLARRSELPTPPSLSASERSARLNDSDPAHSQWTALREGIAISHAQRLAFAISGRDARRAMDLLVCSSTTLRDGQMKQSLILDERGRVLSDVTFGRDGKRYILVVADDEGDVELAEILASRTRELRVQIEDLTRTHRWVGLHGPWAWELAKRLVDENVVAIPYMNLFRFGGGICFRAGTTGEFGFDFLLPEEEFDAFDAALAVEALALDAVVLSHDVWAIAMREQGVAANAARISRRFDLTPVELQLQARLDVHRAYLGRAAIEARLASTETSRRVLSIALEGTTPLVAGSVVRLGAEEVGYVLDSQPSFALGRTVALCVLDSTHAHPWLDGFSIAGCPAISILTPVAENRSLCIDPRRDSYVARAQRSEREAA